MNRLQQFLTNGKTAIADLWYSPPGYIAKTMVHVACHAIFWAWNALFLLVVYLGILPFAGVPLLDGLISGEVPWAFALPLAGLLVIPVACTILGWRRLRSHPVLLMRLFYGVEAPLMVVCTLRLFLLRELTPPSAFLLFLGVLAIAAIALELVVGYAAHRRELAWFQMASHTITLLIGGYVGAILLFYTVPLLCQLGYGFLQFEWLRGVFSIIGEVIRSLRSVPLDELIPSFLSVVWFLLIFLAMAVFTAFSASLFLAMPYALVNMMVRSWGRIFRAFGRQHGWGYGSLITGSVVMACTVGLIALSPQPQTHALAQLSTPPTSMAERQTLLAQSDPIRRGLLNAHLFPYRYLSPAVDANGIEEWYKHLFGMDPAMAQGFQNAHNALLSPFLYQGQRSDLAQAAALYAEFFDEPIQRAEKDTIQQALQSTANRDSVEASLLNINQRVIYLAQQEVTVAPQGDWGEVTLHERYENTTVDDQEIVYQFSLPESAAITGSGWQRPMRRSATDLWCPPRGAAQAVYKAEIERSKQQQLVVDPALLEQVGPQQYRLRVFPIPQRRSGWQPGVAHLWLSYQVMREENGWPLPQLREKRNIYWTGKTERRRQGEAFKTREDWYEGWLPAQGNQAAQTHRVVLPQGYAVTAQPRTDAGATVTGQRLAVVLDTSRSMGDRSDPLSADLKYGLTLAANNTLDWYLTSAAGMAPQRLAAGENPDLENIDFYGNIPLVTQLEQFQSLRQGQTYDAIVVLTDAGNYEMEPDAPSLAAIDSPLYLVHLGGELPPAYEDTLLQTLYKTKGGVATSLSEVVNRYGTEQALDETVMDGYRWKVAAAAADARSGSANNADTGENAFTPIAARQAIRWLSRSRDLTQVAELDQLHAIAKQAEVVTPYSSMLVLVNDRQREALAAAENAADRFSREVETGQDELTDPGNPLNVQVVPEANDFLGFLALLLLGVLGWNQRRLKNQATQP
ncbi:MAG: TIGR02921 family PEP-CTERM protein [Leptolyngbya sp. RL_3_1]|nr:TIGR02921 family PEP-CTERM protein [Leptolyngbya sp. RL_3_1]